MLVSDVLYRLATGQLSNLAMADSTQSPVTIQAASQAKIIGYINDSLMMIYSRFNLYEREVIIQQILTVTRYHLDKRYATTNINRPVGNPIYILDTMDQPFLDDAIKILGIYDECGGSYPLNDNDKCNSLFTPFPTDIQVPSPADGRLMSVIYQAKHKYITEGSLSDEISIPLVLYGPFLSLVAHHVYRDMNTQEMTIKAQEHLVFYETEAAMIEQKSNASIASHSSEIPKFYSRGFV